MKVINY